MKKTISLTAWPGVACRLTLLMLLLLAFLSYRYSATRLNCTDQPGIDRAFYRLFCLLFRLKIHVKGTPSAVKPTLFVANHTSYLDIVILAATVPARFVSKSEVAKMPIFGKLARLQGAIFVNRKRAQSGTERDQMKKRIEEGVNLVMFPEGTTHEGLHVARFKSSLFSAVMGEETEGETATDQPPPPPTPVAVQPLTICFDRLRGMPLTARLRTDYAWIGDMSLFEHISWSLAQGPLEVTVYFGDVVYACDFDSRKVLARYCEEAVRKTLSHHMSALGIEIFETDHLSDDARQVA